MNIRTHIIASVILLLLAGGCSRSSRDPRLARIAASVSDRPEEALVSLDSIDKNSLSKPDRHYLDLLTLKARDKAYIDHESDSLVLDVIDYYSSRPEDPEYPEALYYGGRVYSDLGDYPSALKYFQKALRYLKKSPDTADMECRINNQIGMLLKNLRLFDQAEPYFTNVLNNKIAERDSLGIVYTMQQLGTLYMDLKLTDKADSILTRSMEYEAPIPSTVKALTRLHLAVVNQDKGNIQTALNLVRPTPDQVSPVSKDAALTSAAFIYLDAGITDTAFMYARELIRDVNSLNQKSGYRIILTTEFRNLLPSDTLAQYYEDYERILEKDFDGNRNEQTLMQQSIYNYETHERKRMEAQKSKERMRYVVLGFIVVTVTLSFVVLYLKYRNQTNIVKLRTALDNIENLKKEILSKENHDVEKKTASYTSELLISNNEESLRERLRDSLMDLYKESGGTQVSSSILNSEAYTKIQSLLGSGTPIDGPLWDELKQTVLQASPNFINNLRVLMQGKLSEADIHISLLIKCGFRPSEMTVLLARSNGAIISRREKLCVKILDKKLEVKVIDGIIRLL